MRLVFLIVTAARVTKTLRINRAIIIVASIALVISAYFSNELVVIFHPLVKSGSTSRAYGYYLITSGESAACILASHDSAHSSANFEH